MSILCLLALGSTEVASSVRLPGRLSAFLNKNPIQVATFVSECLDYRRLEAPDLDPYVTRGNTAGDGSV
jgi:hypothetical protein